MRPPPGLPRGTQSNQFPSPKMFVGVDNLESSFRLFIGSTPRANWERYLYCGQNLVVTFPLPDPSPSLNAPEIQLLPCKKTSSHPRIGTISEARCSTFNNNTSRATSTKRSWANSTIDSESTTQRILLFPSSTGILAILPKHTSPKI